MALIYDSSHSGQEIDAAVDSVQTTIPSQLTQIGLKIGDLTQLETEEKDNLVDAINEVKDNIGSSLIVSTDCYDHSTSVASSNNTSKLVIEKTGTGFTVASSGTGSKIYANLLIKGLEIGVEYRLSFHYLIGVQVSADYPYFLTVQTNVNATGSRLAGVVLQNGGLEGDVSLNFTPTTYTTCLRIADNDMPNGNLEVSNIGVYIDKTIIEAVEETQAEISSAKEDIVSIDAKLGNITEENQVPFTEYTETGSTNSSIITASLDTENEQILFDAVGAKTVRTYAWVVMPRLVAGQRYTVKLTYDAEVTYDGWIGVYNGTVQASTSLGGFSAVTGNGVKVSFNFTAIQEPMYFRTASNAMGNAGTFVYIKDMRIFPTSDADYYSLPEITEILDEFAPNVAGATRVGSYEGERIPRLGARYQIGHKKLFNNAGCQAGSVYGDYWFQFTNNHASMSVYDLRTNTLHSTVTMTSVSSDHCNNVCFSNIFYDGNDAFPLLYTSGSSTGSYNHAQAWRIQLVDNVFTIEKVQEIVFPTGTEDNHWWWSQIYFDNELGYMWVSTCHNGVLVFDKFAVPAIFDSGGNVVSNVELTDDDSIDSFTAERSRNQQGGAVHNGVLYLLDGVPAWGTLTKLLVIDLRQKRLINIIDIYHILGITAEFEGAGVYNNTLIASTNGGGVYAIYF